MPDYGYLHRGRVLEIDEAGFPYVEVTSRAAGRKWGPLPTAVAGLEVGDRVVLGAIGTTADDLCVIARYPGRTGIADITGLEDRLDAGEVHDGAQDARLDAIDDRDDEQDGRLDGHDTAIAAGVTKDGQQDTQINNNATAIAANTTAITTLRADTAGKVTTKGDLLVATASGVLARQPVGANGLALVADSAQAGGVAWAERRGTALGLTGATAPTRYVGGTTSGAPTTGTFAVGDFVVSANGDVHVCTVAGTPGTWVTLPGAGPRGLVARVRRTTSVERTGGQDPDNAFKLVELSAAVVAGRAYEVAVLNWGVYSSNAGTSMRGGLTYTTDGSVPTPYSPILTWSQIDCIGSGRVVTIATRAEYLPATSHTLRVCAYMQPQPLNGGNFGTYANADNWPFVLSVTDTGKAVAASGTVF